MFRCRTRTGAADVPVRIRRRVVQIRVQSAYMRVIVRVAAVDRRRPKHRSWRTSNPCVAYYAIYVILGEVSPSCASRNSPSQTSGLQEGAQPMLQYARDGAVLRDAHRAPTSAPLSGSPPWNAYAVMSLLNQRPSQSYVEDDPLATAGNIPSAVNLS